MTTIIAICGSPRRANTYAALQEAIKGAEEVPGTKVEMIELGRLRIEPCIGCRRHTTVEAGPENPCPARKDDFDGKLAAKLAAADGFIVATPVYCGTVSTQLKCFMDRTAALARHGAPGLRGCLRDKVGAGIAVAGNRNGGQEPTLQAIHYWMFCHGMIVVATSTGQWPGCYIGAALTTYPIGGKKDAVLADTLGMEAARATGRRVAEVASWVAGRVKSA